MVTCYHRVVGTRHGVGNERATASQLPHTETVLRRPYYTTTSSDPGREFRIVCTEVNSI